MNAFSTLGLSGPILRAVEAAGYTTPTPIQAEAIPVFLQGHDITGIAQTGTGKTAAFVLPLLEQLAANRERAAKHHCKALILAPTRELAQQIANQIRVYARYLRIHSALITGGCKYPPQIKAMARGQDIIVATPGRLIDHMQEGHIDLSETATVILDEADQMLDLGFLQPIRRILQACAPKRQTVLLSATMPKPIRALADEFLASPAEIATAAQAQPIERIDQQVRHIKAADKPQALIELLQTQSVFRGIIFTRTKYGAEKLAKQLNQAELAAEAIHGNKTQGQRARALKAFKTGKITLLVATDVAARGIDIDGVSHVFNFELPNVAETYVHRIGRTARAGESGAAIAFCDASERPFLRDIEKLIQAKIRVEGPEPEPLKKRAKPPARNARRKPAHRSGQARAANDRSSGTRAADDRRGQARAADDRSGQARAASGKSGQARADAARAKPKRQKPQRNRSTKKPNGQARMAG